MVRLRKEGSAAVQASENLIEIFRISEEKLKIWSWTVSRMRISEDSADSEEDQAGVFCRDFGETSWRYSGESVWREWRE